MPLGKRKKSVKMPTGVTKEKIDHQQWLAENNPEPTYNLSACELEFVPSGVYSVCNALLKKSLFLYDNKLTEIEDKANTLGDLTGLEIFDLHSNRLERLPKDIGLMRSLCVLNLENNCLHELPVGLCSLASLQLLNVSRNQLTTLPDRLPDLKSLQSLDISGNRIKNLPENFGLVRTLGVISLDTDKMMFPPSGVCSEGLETMMKFLCQRVDGPYVAPSVALAERSEELGRSGKGAKTAMEVYYDQVERDFKSYEGQQDKKRRELVELERRKWDIDQNMAEAAFKASTDRQREFKQQQKGVEEYEGTVAALYKEKEARNKCLLEELRQADEHTQSLIQRILESSERAELQEKLLEELEEAQLKETEYCVVKASEYQALRKKEVYDMMQALLLEHQAYDEKLAFAQRQRAATNEMVKARMIEEDENIESILVFQDKEKGLRVEDLIKQEVWQREAVESLMMQKDARHSRLTGEIAAIEKELIILSVKEAKNREHINEMNKKFLVEQRSELTELLRRLMAERSERASALRLRLEEMAQLREQDEIDFWLVQLQRLMDRKPEALLAREAAGIVDVGEEAREWEGGGLDRMIVEVLKSAGAQKYMVLFAEKRVSTKALLAMGDLDLQQLGVTEEDLRASILKNVRAHTDSAAVLDQMRGPELDYATPSYKVKGTATEESHPLPSAPTDDEQEEGATRSQVEIRARISNECVVCMERESNIIFLNCGHVCTCSQCAQPLTECPLCRAEIVQRVRLERRTLD